MKKKICFVGYDNYPVLNPDAGTEYFGGESVQQTLLAKAFHDLGYEVSMICGDYGQSDGEVIDGITIYKTYGSSEGLPIVRFIYPRMTSIFAALKRADADIYYQSCAGMMTGMVAWYCRSNNRKFVFRLAHDSDCIPGQQIIKYWRDRKLYEYGLKRTDMIAAQGVNQVELLQKNYQLESIPINMAVEIPKLAQSRRRDIDILWVNNLRDFKRPELVVDLAKLLPEFNIAMIGGAVPGNDELYDKVKAEANKLDNLSFLGAVSYHEVNNYFLRAKVFVNTSDWEGFPNSFLQAWIRQVPVFSFFDPDGLIKAKAIGESPENLDHMADLVRQYLLSDDKVETVGKRGQEFVLNNYAPKVIARRYEKLLA